MGMTLHFEKTKTNLDVEQEEALVTKLRGLIGRSTKRYVACDKRVREFVSALSFARMLLPKDYNIVISTDEICRSGVFVTIRSKSIDITQSREFVNNVLRIADSFEVVTYLNGDVELGLSFYGMAREED